MTAPLFNRITIIGLGLIGSSIARAVHAHKMAGIIVGCDANELSLAFARKEGFIDVATCDITNSVAGSDLVIIATPPASLSDVAQAISENLAQGALIIDVASVKQPAIEAIAPHMPDHVVFIPTHPIAGSEQTGVKAGRADLFDKKRIIITPEEPPEENLQKRISAFWGVMGAKVEGMPPEVHDLLYGYMSHLPQLLAFGLKKPLGEFFNKPQANLAYGKFLRISASDAALWADIFYLNKENIIKGLDRYLDVILHIYNELKNAPEGEESKREPLLAHTLLFPRIVASCLVTTVMEAEKNAGFPFARFAGMGFADFSCPALAAPEEDIERISAQYQLVASILDSYIKRLGDLREAVASGEIDDIARAINS